MPNNTSPRWSYNFTATETSTGADWSTSSTPATPVPEEAIEPEPDDIEVATESTVNARPQPTEVWVNVDGSPIDGPELTENTTADVIRNLRETVEHYNSTLGVDIEIDTEQPRVRRHRGISGRARRVITEVLGVEMPGSLLQDSNIKQPRLLAAVTRNGELMFVAYEKGGNFMHKKLGLEMQVDTWLVRKCPPHIAKKLVEFDSTEGAKDNRYKAWEYIVDAGFMLRQL